MRFRNGFWTVFEINLRRESRLQAKYKKRQRPREEVPEEEEGERMTVSAVRL